MKALRITAPLSLSSLHRTAFHFPHFFCSSSRLVTPVVTCAPHKPHVLARHYSKTKRQQKGPLERETVHQAGSSKLDNNGSTKLDKSESEELEQADFNLPNPETYLKNQNLKDKEVFEKLLDPAATLTPNEQLAKVYLLLFEKEPQRAIDVVTELLTSPQFSNEWRASVLGLRAIAYQSLRQLKKAMDDLNSALEYSPNDIRYISLRGHLRMTTQDFNGALKDFGMAIDLGGSDEHIAEFWFAVAKIYYRHKQFYASENALTEVEKLTKHNSNLYLHSQRYRAMCHLKSGEEEKFLERIAYILANTQPQREKTEVTQANYIGLRPKNLGDLHIDCLLTRAISYYNRHKMWDEALADLEVVYSTRKEKYGIELFEQMIRIMNEKYGLHKLMKFTEKPVPLPKVDPEICNKMLANYKHLEKLNGPSYFTTVEMYLWRAIGGESEIAIEGIEASLHDQLNDYHSLALSQLYIQNGMFDKAIYNFERMFPNQETDLADAQIACVLHQLAWCAIQLEWKSVAKRALDEIPNLNQNAREDSYWKELYRQMEKLTRDISP